MKDVLKEFNRALGDLRHHIEYIEAEKRVFARILEPPTYFTARQFSAVESELAKVANLASLGAVKRQYDYSSIIVGLYGLFENYLESLLKSYLDVIQGMHSKYTDLPEKIRENHIAVTAVLLSKPDLQKFKNLVSPNALAANLHSCLSNSTDFKLNVEAYTYHTANFRAGTIDEFFARVAISGISGSVFRLESFSDFLVQYAPERKIIPNVQQDLFPEINDLADRRNEVAHGSQVEELLSNSILLDYTRVIEAYGHAVYKILESEAMSIRVDMHGVSVNRCIIVYNNSIVCLEIARGTTVSVGDLLVARRTGNAVPVIWGEILGIQIDKLEINAMSAIQNINVAFRVGYYAKDNYVFKILNS
jgi:hypothetical protein